MKQNFATAIALLAGALWGASANASTIYDYAGQHFTYEWQQGNYLVLNESYSASDSINGSLTLSTALGDNLNGVTLTPTAFSFSDGLQTLTNLNTNQNTFQVWTNAAGQIVEWNISVGVIDGLTSAASITTQNPPNPGFVQDISTIEVCGTLSSSAGQCVQGAGYNQIFGQVVYLPGVWTVASAPVPLPSTLTLLGLGLAGVGFVRRKKALSLA